MSAPSRTKQAQKAHNDLWTAIWNGSVIPAERCEQCGSEPRFYDKIQGHHDDYSKPLDVRWLCRSCHTQHHLAERRAAGLVKAKPAPKRRRAA